jgi:hypothetical protein
MATSKYWEARWLKAYHDGQEATLGPKGRTWVARHKGWETRWLEGAPMGRKGKMFERRLSELVPGRGGIQKRRKRWIYIEEPIDDLIGDTGKKKK